MRVMIGIDPHKGSHTAVVINSHEARSVAIAALRHSGLTPVVVDDHTRVLGLLAKRHRDVTDVARLKNKAACRLHALLGEFTAVGCPQK